MEVKIESQNYISQRGHLSRKAQELDIFRNDGRNFSSGYRNYADHLSLEKITKEFAEVTNWQKSERLAENENIMCYVLGREFSGQILRFLVSKPTWLEPLCEGLKDNPQVLDLHLHFPGSNMGLNFTDRRDRARSLEYVSKLLNHGCSVKGLRISSSFAMAESYPHLAAAVRTNKLQRLDTSAIQDDEILTEGQKEIAIAAHESSSIEELSLCVVGDMLESYFYDYGPAPNRSIRVLTLVFRIDNADFEPYFEEHLYFTPLSFSPALRKLSLVGGHLPWIIWMQIVDSLKTNPHIRVLDIGSSTGWFFEAFLAALHDLLCFHCKKIIDLGLDLVCETDVKANDVLKVWMPKLQAQLLVNKVNARERLNFRVLQLLALGCSD